MLYNKLVNAPVTVFKPTADPIHGHATGQFDTEHGFELHLVNSTLWLEPKTFSMVKLIANDGETIELGPNFKRLKNFGSAGDVHNPSQPLLYAAKIICKALKHTVLTWNEDGKTKHLCSACGFRFED